MHQSLVDVLPIFPTEPVHQAHAAGGIGDFATGKQVIQRIGNGLPAKAAAPGGAKAAVGQVPATDGDGRRLLRIGQQQLGHLARWMLTVAVDLHTEIKVMALRVFDAGLHRTANPKIAHQPHRGCFFPRNAERVVARAVINHQHGMLRVALADLLQQ